MSKADEQMRALTLTLTTADINLVLEALGQLPFVKVYALVAKVQQQAREQLAGKPEEMADGV